MALCTCQKAVRSVESNQKKKDPSSKKNFLTSRTAFPSSSSSLIEHSLSSAHFTYAPRWGFNHQRKHLWCQRKEALLAGVSCPGNVLHQFCFPRHQSDSKGMCLHNISLIIPTNIGESKELVSVPLALHSKLPANQESNTTRQENIFSMPTSAQQNSQEHCFGQTLSCSVLWAQLITCADTNAPPEVLSWNHF